MTEPAHSPLGPSSSERWLECPGSVLPSMDLPDEETEYSREGSCAHHVAQLARAAKKPASLWLGQSYFGIKVDRMMVSCVQEYIEYVNALPGDDYNEERIYYREYVKAGFGTMDAVRATTRRAHVVDLKYGEGVQVFAEKNTQLMLYALGFYLTYGWLYDLDDFVLTVFQPRLAHIDSWVVSLDDLLHWAELVVRPGGIRALEPGAPRMAGDWCTFCKLRRTCTTRGKAVATVMVGELEDLDRKPFPEPQTLTSEQVARILRVKKMALAWFADVQKHALAELHHGRQVGGFKVVEGRSDRRWAVSEEEVADTISREMMLSEEATRMMLYEEPALLSPAKMEAVFSPLYFKPASEKRKAGVFAHLIDKPKGKPVLAPPEDQRTDIGALVTDEMDALDVEFDL